MVQVVYQLTPSHDPNDFEVGARHDLGQCVVLDSKAHIVDGYGRYSGMDRYEARKANAWLILKKRDF